MTFSIATAVRSVAAAAMLVPLVSFAAPELFITWKASSYVPARYAGKALPVAGTPIEAKAILVDNGKVISLAPYSVNWYAGEDRIGGGTGIATIRTAAPVTGQDTLELRVSVGKYGGQPLDAFATVPVVRPKIIIRKTGTQNGFSIVPYFWNITDPQGITVTWTDNGDGITAQAANKKNALEFAAAAIPKR